MRTKIILAFSILSYLPSRAQEIAGNTGETAAKPIQVPQMFFEPSTYIWILLGGIIIASILTLSHAVSALTRELEEKTSGLSLEKESVQEYQRKENLWNKVMHMMTRSVQVEKEADVMLDHNYDGIRELDNQLPPWWKWGFGITIVFAFVYIIIFHIAGTGNLQAAEYKEEMKAAELQKQERMKADANYVTEANVVRLTDAASVGEGKDVFVKLCVACHGDKGQGNVGPNLTDVYWIHGGGIKNIFNTITQGVPDKGMISWKSQLSPRQIQLVASYIMTLEGTNPPGAKDPQGTEWKEAPVSSGDSTVVADTTASKG